MIGIYNLNGCLKVLLITSFSEKILNLCHHCHQKFVDFVSKVNNFALVLFTINLLHLILLETSPKTYLKFLPLVNYLSDLFKLIMVSSANIVKPNLSKYLIDHLQIIFKIIPRSIGFQTDLEALK